MTQLAEPRGQSSFHIGSAQWFFQLHSDRNMPSLFTAPPRSVSQPVLSFHAIVNHPRANSVGDGDSETHGSCTNNIKQARRLHYAALEKQESRAWTSNNANDSITSSSVASLCLSFAIVSFRPLDDVLGTYRNRSFLTFIPTPLRRQRQPHYTLTSACRN
jgi:hypothetical protein